MYKKLFVFLSLFLSANSFGADHCTNPKEYTIDERCYVTDAQKKMSPYNAVVALVSMGYFYCTGTIVKCMDGKPCVYTAKHCVMEGRASVKSKIQIMLQDGTKLEAIKNNVGDLDYTTKENPDGDWAVYKIYKKNVNVPMVEKTSKIKIGIAPFDVPYDARVVGYGSLKIMSDKEISEFRNKYVAYLKNKKKINTKEKEFNYGFYRGSIDPDNGYVRKFIYNVLNDYRMMSDSSLKESECKFLSSGRPKGCQAWSGNSGGPIFDSNGKIIGILIRGNGLIGGKYHAGKEGWWTSSTQESVSLLK